MARQGPVTRDTSSLALGLAQIRVGNSAAHIATATPVLTAADSLGAMASTSFAGNVDYWKHESGFPLMEDLTIPLRESDALECAFEEVNPRNLALARGIDVTGDVDATAAELSVNTVAGTVAAPVTVDNAGGVIAETWTVLFTSATTYEIIGTTLGHIATGDTTIESAPDNGGNPYFTIPANNFTGTWAADETYIFVTSPYASGTTAYDDPHAGSIPLGTISAPAFIRMEALYTFPNGTDTMTFIFPRANVTSSVEMDLQAEDAVAVTMNFEAKLASSDVSGGNPAWDVAPLGILIFA